KDLNSFARRFAEGRGVSLAPEPSPNLESVFAKILTVADKQFDPNLGRAAINQKYVSEIHAKICAEFVHNRGRAGRMMVLNQDRFLLLTNLAVGKRECLRLSELVDEFRRRGVWLDAQSQLALVAFYERLGNVERMSDSGDAINVRKTL